MNNTSRRRLVPKKDSGKVWWVASLVTLIGMWVGFKLLGLRFEHQKIKGSIESLADRALMQGSHGVEAEVVKVMKSYDAIVDLDAIKLEVTPNKDKVTLEFPYDRVVDFIVTLRKYPFYIHVERYPNKGGGSLGKGLDSQVQDSMKTGSGRYGETFQNP